MYEYMFKREQLINPEAINIFFLTRARRYYRKELAALIAGWGIIIIIYILDGNNIGMEYYILMCLAVLATIIIVNWQKYHYLIENLFITIFKDNTLASVVIRDDLVYIYNDKMYYVFGPCKSNSISIINRCKEKYKFDIANIRLIKGYIFETKRYIFFTRHNHCFLFYLDKETLSEDDINNIRNYLKSIFGKCYIETSMENDM